MDYMFFIKPSAKMEISSVTTVAEFICVCINCIRDTHV